MNVTLKQLRAFLAVARGASFTSAAEGLFVSQPALSSLIKEFETAVGVRLLDRSTRRNQLSEVGRGLFPLLDKIVQDLDRVLAEVSDIKALKKGLVRIAAPQLLACTLMPEFVAHYREAHPGITMRLVDCRIEEVIPKVASGEADFGVGPERVVGCEVGAVQLFELPFMAVFPAGHPLEAQAEVSWAQLSAHPFITMQGLFAERISVDLRDVSLTPAHEVAFMSTALSMASSGLGVTACIPYAQPLVKLYRLQMRPLIDPVIRRRFFVVSHAGRSLSPAAHSAMESLKDFCRMRWPGGPPGT